MEGQKVTKRNTKTDASTQGAASAAFARQKLSARFPAEISTIAIPLNSACRLYLFSRPIDNRGQPLGTGTELLLTRATLTTLAEGLPKALAQADQSQTNAANKCTAAPGEE